MNVGQCEKHGQVELENYGFKQVCSVCLKEYREALARCHIEEIQRHVERQLILGENYDP